MKKYPQARDGLLDAMRLAEGMNNKFAISNIALDGAKAVLTLPDNFDNSQREALLIRYAQWLNALGGIFKTAADMGTTMDDMILLSKHTSGIFGLPPEMGGIGDQGIPTALGVFSGIQAACEHLFGTSDLSQRSILVQGLGSVGGALIELLIPTTCEIKFSDMNPDLIQHYQELGLSYVAPENVYRESCDVFAPCALGSILNSRTIPQLQAKIVVGSANNQLESRRDSESLHQRNILYAPDFVVNAGAAIYGTAIEIDKVSIEEGEKRVRAIGATLREILHRSQSSGDNPLLVAEQITHERSQKRGQN
jgi:glutamate dehydrogenase/leucine dehydrogenase